MKSLNNDDDSNTWLGFSLSHMKMESSSPTTPASHQSVYQTQALNYGVYYGVEGDQNGGFYSNHLPVMPIKSDGSLCIMEALGRSQHQQQQQQQG